MGDCGAPINLENGSVRLSRSYLRTQYGSFDLSWFNLFSQGGSAANPSQGIGTNWVSSNFAYQIDPQDGTLGFVWDPSRGGKVDFFSESGPGQYTACYCSLDKLTETTTDFRVAMPDGTVAVFNKSSGMIKQNIEASGQETDFTYDSSIHRITEQRRTETVSGQTTVESRKFDYFTSGDNSGRLQYVTLRQATTANPTSGDWTDVRRIELVYYGSGETHGNLGDLKRIKQQVLVGMTWTDDQIEYFRYYKDSAGGTGYQHGLKMVISPECYDQLTNPDNMSDVQLKPYSSLYYEYDSNRRANAAATHGGTVNFSVVYSRNDALGHFDYNRWYRKAVMTSPDGSFKTVYSNHIGQDLLVDLVDGGDRWILYTRYNNDGRTIERAQPSAIDMNAAGGPYNPAFDNLDVQLNPDSGLIELTSYYADNDPDPAAAPGRPKLQQVKKGSAGTVANGGLVTTSKNEYELHTVGSGAETVTIYPLKKGIRYQSDASGGSDPVETVYDNVFWPGTTQLKKRTTHLPDVGARSKWW